MKRFITACSATLLALAVSVADAAVTVKIAGSKPDGNPQTIGMRVFAQRLGQLSSGKYKSKFFRAQT